MHVSQSGIRKTKTTKETRTKNSPKGEERKNTGSSTQENEQPEGKSLPRWQSSSHRSDDQPETHRFLRAYRQEFRRHTPNGEPPVINWGKDGKLVKQLLRLYPYQRLVELLERFFLSAGEWEHMQGYSLYVFKSSIGRLLVSEANAESKLRAAIQNPVTIHTPGWSRAAEPSASGSTNIEREQR
jgi:hypothetical protein